MNKTVEEQISEFLSNSQENIKAAYLKGYNNGLNDGNINDGTFAAKVREAYNNGLNDAWECARKIYDMPCDDESNTLICPSCRWYDYTQKQCFDGHIQNKSACGSYKFDDHIPTKKEIQAETVKLMNLMVKAKISGECISFYDGGKIEVKISKEKSQND